MRELRAVVGVVVGDLVVVPGHQPRARRVGGLQVGVRLVERVPDAIVIQRVRFGGAVLADVIAPPRGLVDVVAEEDDQVEVLGQHPVIGPVVTLLVLLAGGEREAQPLDGGAGGRGGPGAPDGTGLAAGPEPVPVPASRLQALDFHVNRVGPPGRGRHRALLDDLAHALVAGHLPVDADDAV
jgi:hypothetical protein